MEKKSKEIRVDELSNNNNTCWSLLPRDLVEKILEKLCFLDCIRAVASCKNWNMIPVPAIYKYSLPWLIEQDWSAVIDWNRRAQLCCKLNLYEALNPKVHPPICRTFDLAVGDYHQFRRFDTVGPARVKDSKFGWLLIEIRIFISARKRSRFLVLYSPFVQHDRQFRFLPVSRIPMICHAAFSCPPTSSDCVVYAITETRRGAPSLNIHSWRWCNDQMNWKVESHNNNNNIVPNCMFRSIIAMKDGTLYCLGQNAGNLIAFKYSSNSAEVQTISTDTLVVDLVGMDILNAQLAECDCELFLICFCRSYRSWWCRMIYWYDTSANCWSMKQRWDHPKSFIPDHHQSYDSGLATTLGPAAMRIGNRVYVWRMGSDGLMFYSSDEDGKPARVAVEEIFPSYHRGSRVRLLSMGPSLA